MSFRKQLNVMMADAGCELVSEKKHLKWKHHSGVIITTSKTPSDINALKQIGRDLRRRLSH